MRRAALRSRPTDRLGRGCPRVINVSKKQEENNTRYAECKRSPKSRPSIAIVGSVLLKQTLQDTEYGR